MPYGTGQVEAALTTDYKWPAQPGSAEPPSDISAAPAPPRAKVVYAIIVTVDEGAELLGVSRRTVLREIARLCEEGRITRVGSDKTGHGVVK